MLLAALVQSCLSLDTNIPTTRAFHTKTLRLNTSADMIDINIHLKICTVQTLHNGNNCIPKNTVNAKNKKLKRHL